MRLTYPVVLVLLALVLGQADDAAACSPPFCPATGPLPAGTDEAPAHLPANGVTILLGWPSMATSGSTLVVERLRAGVSAMLPVDPTAALITIDDAAAGDVLHVTMTYECFGSSAQTSTTVIEVTDPAALPTELGRVDVSAPRRAPVDVWDNRGSCTSPIDSVRAEYSLVTDAAAAPWSDALVVTTFVDEAPWQTTQGDEAGSGFVFEACAAPLPSQSFEDVGAGPHRIRMEAAVRGTDVVVSSDEATVVLDCAAAGGGGCSVTPGRSAPSLWLSGLGFVIALRRSRRRAG
jgi:hypothetical protein